MKSLDRPESDSEWEALEDRYIREGRCLALARWSPLGICGRPARVVVGGRPHCAGHALPGTIEGGQEPARPSVERGL